MADWVIVVDDDPANLKVAGRILSEHGMRVTALKSGLKMLDYIRENGTPDIVLLDIMMPDMDGFEVLSRLRELEQEMLISPTPVVFLTADEDRGSEMRGFQMGVADFIRKPFDPDILVQRISNIITANRKLQTIEEEAARDNLTGFLNKEYSRDQIAAACLKENGCLCMIDLDSFKLVNDIYGHETGDNILTMFADILRDNMTPESVCGRIGGDEFLLFALHMKREDDIREFARKLNAELVDGAKKILGEDMRIPLGVSVGAVSVPAHGTDYNELFRMADKALYVVKDNGKHGYYMYKPEDGEEESESTAGMDLNAVSKLLEERSIPQSVMWMGREAFGNVYRYMMRYFERYDIPAYKALFTLDYKGNNPDDQEKERISEALRGVIQTSLRNSDIMVQIGAGQFFLLLPELSSENADRVINRMVSAWDRAQYAGQASIICEYESVTANKEG